VRAHTHSSSSRPARHHPLPPPGPPTHPPTHLPLAAQQRAEAALAARQAAHKVHVALRGDAVVAQGQLILQLAELEHQVAALGGLRVCGGGIWGEVCVCTHACMCAWAWTRARAGAAPKTALP